MSCGCARPNGARAHCAWHNTAVPPGYMMLPGGVVVPDAYLATQQALAQAVAQGELPESVLDAPVLEQLDALQAAHRSKRRKSALVVYATALGLGGVLAVVGSGVKRYFGAR